MKGKTLGLILGIVGALLILGAIFAPIQKNETKEFTILTKGNATQYISFLNLDNKPLDITKKVKAGEKITISFELPDNLKLAMFEINGKDYSALPLKNIKLEVKENITITANAQPSENEQPNEDETPAVTTYSLALGASNLSEYFKSFYFKDLETGETQDLLTLENVNFIDNHKNILMYEFKNVNNEPKDLAFSIIKNDGDVLETYNISSVFSEEIMGASFKVYITLKNDTLNFEYAGDITKNVVFENLSNQNEFNQLLITAIPKDYKLSLTTNNLGEYFSEFYLIDLETSETQDLLTLENVNFINDHKNMLVYKFKDVEKLPLDLTFSTINNTGDVLRTYKLSDVFNEGVLGTGFSVFISIINNASFEFSMLGDKSTSSVHGSAISYYGLTSISITATPQITE